MSPTNDIPPPGRVYRSDVAALAIASCSLEPENSYTLGIRAVGEIDSASQGILEDGSETVDAAMDKVVQSNPEPWVYGNSKPVGPAVAIFVYSLAAIALTVTKAIAFKLGHFISGRVIKFKGA